MRPGLPAQLAAELPGLRRRILIYRGQRRLKTEEGIDIWPLELFLDVLQTDRLWPFRKEKTRVGQLVDPLLDDVDRASVLSRRFAVLIRDGFSSTVRRATQEGRASFEVAQQSCRRKGARSGGVNFWDSTLVFQEKFRSIREDKHARRSKER